LALGEIISPILAAKMGYGLPQSEKLLGIEALGNNAGKMVPELRPVDHNGISWDLSRQFVQGSRGFCQLQYRFHPDLGMEAIAFADGDEGKKPSPDKGKEPEKAGPKKPEPKPDLPEEFLGQAIKHIVMHEVGHSLGLRHNFKASTMLTADQLNDTNI